MYLWEISSTSCVSPFAAVHWDPLEQFLSPSCMFLELSLKTLSLTPKGPTPGEPPTPTWNLFWWTLPSSNKQRSASPSLLTEAPDFWLSYSPGLNSGLIFVPFCSSIFTHYHLASSALRWSSNSTLHLQPIIKNTCSNVWWEKKERRSLLDYLQFSFQSLHQLCAFFFLTSLSLEPSNPTTWWMGPASLRLSY